MQLIKRERYLKEALRFRDTDLIKVVTGIRRCGKSSLLHLVEATLIEDGVLTSNIIKLNLESLTSGIENFRDLYNAVKSQIVSKDKTYIFIDEVQNVPGWEKAINSLRVDFDCDIYITGSNAFLLSSELSTYLSGRYVEIKMLPLVFTEFLDFCNLVPAKLPGQEGLLIDGKGNTFLLDHVFSHFRRYGGMPSIATLNLEQEDHRAYHQTLYESVVARDILDRERDRSRRTITQPQMLRRICLYLADNIGNPCSMTKIKDALKSFGYTSSPHTVEAYIRALVDAYVFYPAKRYDIRGKDHLKTLGKYYVVDSGLRNYLLDYRDLDQGRVLENLVYLQLLFEGYSVSVGKLYNKEVDFVAIKGNRRIYIQVTEEMFDEKTKDRELSPLLAIRDGFEKFIIVGEGSYPKDIDGIKIITAPNFFLECSQWL